MFNIKPCKTKAAYSVKPIKKIKLDLNKIKNHFKVSIFTPICMVIEEHKGIVVHNHGEILFKKLKDEAKIKKISEKIYKVGS